MKKLIILSLVTIGIGAAATTSRANGFGVAVALSRPCPPLVFSATVPILVPPPVVLGGFSQAIIVRDNDRDHLAGFSRERFHERLEARRDAHFRHDRF